MEAVSYTHLDVYKRQLVCIITFIGGIQLFCMGIIGQYIAKIYLETKHRPHYIVLETNKKDIQRIR